MAMTGLEIVITRQVLGSQFTVWWSSTIPKLIFITIVTPVVGTILGIPLARILAQSAPPLTLKGSLVVFSMTAIGVILDLLFSLIVGFTNACKTSFLISYTITILLLTVALYIAFFCFKQ
jgi:hypothetical protein